MIGSETGQRNACIHTHIHMDIHTHIHTCIHTYIHIYIETYMHYITYIHTYIQHTYTHIHSEHSLCHLPPHMKKRSTQGVSPLISYVFFVQGSDSRDGVDQPSQSFLILLNLQPERLSHPRCSHAAIKITTCLLLLYHFRD